MVYVEKDDIDEDTDGFDDDVLVDLVSKSVRVRTYWTKTSQY